MHSCVARRGGQEVHVKQGRSCCAGLQERGTHQGHIGHDAGPDAANGFGLILNESSMLSDRDVERWTLENCNVLMWECTVTCSLNAALVINESAMTMVSVMFHVLVQLVVGSRHDMIPTDTMTHHTDQNKCAPCCIGQT